MISDTASGCRVGTGWGEVILMGHGISTTSCNTGPNKGGATLLQKK